MSKNEKDDGKEFTFIKERILPKRKSRWKKVCISFGTTVVLAIVFGAIARVSFIVSEPFINRILGIDSNKKEVILSGSVVNGIEPGETVSSKNETEEKKEPDATVKEKDQIKTPVPYELPNSQADIPAKTEEDSKTVNNTYYVDHKVSATANDFVTMYSDLRSIANETSKALVTITKIVTDVDVLENAYDTKTQVPGLVVANNGVEFLILVDYKEIKDANSLKATLIGGVNVEATLQQYDTETNLAILAVRLHDLSGQVIKETKVANLGESYVLSNGTPVMAIGSLNGMNQSLDIGAVTNCSGVVYLTDLKLDLFYTNMNASVNGLGYVINFDGEVVGIITNEFRKQDEQPMCTAIGISRVKQLIEKMANGKDRVYIGIIAEDMPADQLAEAGLNYGIYVTDVVAKSPAYEAGIQIGDIIVMLNGNPVGGMNSFVSGMNNLSYKDEIQVEIARYSNGEVKNMELALTVGRVK